MKKTILVLTLPIVLAAAILGGGVLALEQHYDSTARRQAVAGLRDPDSALFRNMKVITRDRLILGGYPDWVLCGEMNARNGMGGYEGYRAFQSGPFGVTHPETALDRAYHANACGAGDGSSWAQRLGHLKRVAALWWRGDSF